MAGDSPRESSIVAACLALVARWAGARGIKTHGGPLRGGEPDLYILCQGVFFAIEVKRPGEPYPLTPLQSATLEKWRAAGAVAGVVHSAEELRLVVQNGLAERGRELRSKQ